jgi:hypothetical protein
MDRHQLTAILAQKADNGMLITPKHDQTSASTPYQGYRTIVCMTNQEMSKFIRSGNYTIRRYSKTNQNHPPHFYEIEPYDPMIVPGSGIQSMSTSPTTSCDRFVVVSGGLQGWHLYTETSSNIQQQINKGVLTYIAEL